MKQKANHRRYVPAKVEVRRHHRSQVGRLSHKDANLSTTMHECCHHQISFNCGLFPRQTTSPPPSPKASPPIAKRPTTATRRPSAESTRCGSSALRAHGKYIPLTDLLKNEQWLKSHEVLLGYAQSWAPFSIT